MSVRKESGAASVARVGFVGLGDMGEPMAHNLLAKGFEVSVFDLRPGPLKIAKDKGAQVAASLADLADSCDTIGLCVWNEDQLTDCIYGEGGLFSSETTGRTLLIHSTVTPGFIARLAKSCGERGWHLLDAPVSGARAGSIAGTLTLMVGGDRASFLRCEPYLKAVGSNVFHMGETPGAGSVMKLCNNVMALCNAFVANEAFKLATAFGIDERRVIECARVSTGNSWIIEHPGFFDNLLTTHPQPDVLYKDLWEAVEAGKSKGLELTISGLVALCGPRMSEERKTVIRERSSRESKE